MESFDIFETMLVSNNRIFILNYHLFRMFNSAKILKFEIFLLERAKRFYKDFASTKNFALQYLVWHDFTPNSANIKHISIENLKNIESLWFSLSDFLETLGLDAIHLDSKDYILRLILKRSGILKYEILPLDKIIHNDIFISKNIINHNDIFSRYKTTNRLIFSDSLQKIQEKCCFDFIYFNERGELTQGSRSNIILKLNGKYTTPHFNCGVLPGTFLRLLLNFKIDITQSVITRDDLLGATEIYCINSVRGTVKTKLNKSESLSDQGLI